MVTALLGILAAYKLPGGSTTAPKVAASSSASNSTTTNSSTQTANNYKDGTFTGVLASGDYEDIQVAITVSGGKITDVTTPQANAYSSRSRMIDDYAIPQLKQEVITQQSASIDSISGATYTTQTYIQSLQSAIDQAKA